MTKQVKEAIEYLIDTTFKYHKDAIQAINQLKDAYLKQLDNRTDTQIRIDYLQECLDSGMSKREAAKALCVHDPRVGPGTSETLVYTVFSGQYQKTRRGRRGKVTKAIHIERPVFNPPPSPMDDEDII